ncbi:MAG TPA: hypothetical protein VGN13_12205 [Solirubrobacteraceae bacterium]
MTRYTSKIIARASEHVAAGWTVARTIDLLESEFGSRPHATTVRLWTDEKYAKRHRAANRARSRRRWRETHPLAPIQRTTGEWRLARMRQLRDAGLSHEAIGVVAGVWWGQELSGDTVARKLRQKLTRRRGPVGGLARAR